MTKLRHLVDEEVPALRATLKNAGFDWPPSLPLVVPPQTNLLAPPGAP